MLGSVFGESEGADKFDIHVEAFIAQPDASRRIASHLRAWRAMRENPVGSVTRAAVEIRQWIAAADGLEFSQDCDVKF